MIFIITRTSLAFSESSPYDDAERHVIDGKVQWITNIQDLSALLLLIAEEGRVIIDITNDDIPTLEIYDDYRE